MYGRETETDREKRKKFQWTQEMIKYLLDSLKRYKVMCNFSRNDFDANKTVQNSKLRKEMAKVYETPANPRADSPIQQIKEFEGKIKLENKLIIRTFFVYLIVSISCCL